jgi:peptide deformylase
MDDLLRGSFDFSNPLDFPRFNGGELQRWWFTRMVYTRRPFEEKMTLFWHNHFATSASKTGDLFIYNQNLTIRDHALDQFDKLLLRVSQDPAMLLWLDGVTNVRGKPNENFARELQELFTMGITDVVTGEANYTEEDVKEIARAFTGWKVVVCGWMLMKYNKAAAVNPINVVVRTASRLVIMPAKEILQLGNPVLWQHSAEVTDVKSAETRDIVRDLSDTLAAFREATGYGRGIAAPQIGVLRRVVFIRMQPVGFCTPLINPEISWSSDARMELWDDCFSFPDLMVRVSRAAQIRVDYLDDRGRQQTVEAEGDLSELLQHEIDHLDGILAVQRGISSQAFATRAEWERSLKG